MYPKKRRTKSMKNIMPYWINSTRHWTSILPNADSTISKTTSNRWLDVVKTPSTTSGHDWWDNMSSWKTRCRPTKTISVSSMRHLRKEIHSLTKWTEKYRNWKTKCSWCAKRSKPSIAINNSKQHHHTRDRQRERSTTFPFVVILHAPTAGCLIVLTMVERWSIGGQLPNIDHTICFWISAY